MLPGGFSCENRWKVDLKARIATNRSKLATRRTDLTGLKSPGASGTFYLVSARADESARPFLFSLYFSEELP